MAISMNNPKKGDISYSDHNCKEETKKFLSSSCTTGVSVVDYELEFPEMVVDFHHVQVDTLKVEPMLFVWWVNIWHVCRFFMFQIICKIW